MYSAIIFRSSVSLKSSSMNEEKDHVYALLTLLPQQGGGNNELSSHVLSLRAGNYLSRNMSRRTFLAEHGDEILLVPVPFPGVLDGLSARFLDRGGLLKDQSPEAAGHHIKEALIELARAFVQAQQEAE
jgi:hypothetical protein